MYGWMTSFNKKIYWRINIPKTIWIFIGKVLWPKAFWWLFCEFSISIQCDLHFEIWVLWEFQFVCWTLTLFRVDFKWIIAEFCVVFSDHFNLWATWEVRQSKTWKFYEPKFKILSSLRFLALTNPKFLLKEYQIK